MHLPIVVGHRADFMSFRNQSPGCISCGRSVLLQTLPETTMAVSAKAEYFYLFRQTSTLSNNLGPWLRNIFAPALPAWRISYRTQGTRRRECANNLR